MSDTRSLKNPFTGSHTAGVRAVYRGLGGNAKNQLALPEIEVDKVKNQITVSTKKHKLHLNKKESGGEEGTWIYSFADLIMNLLMFFVMLFAISSIDKTKMNQIQEAFSSYSKSKAKPVPQDQKPKQDDNAGQGFAFQSFTKNSNQKLSNADLLEEMKKLAARLDQKLLEKNLKQNQEFKNLEKAVKGVEPLLAAQWKGDPLNDAIEIAFARESLLDKKSGRVGISKKGARSLTALSAELKGLNNDMVLQVKAIVPSKVVSPSVMADSSFEASLVLSEILRSLPLPPAMTSASSFGGYMHEQAQEMQKPMIIVRIGLSPTKGGRTP